MNREVTTLMERVLYEVKKVVVGQDHFLERVLVAMLAQGHLLVEGVPGLAKTLTVKTLARTVRGQFRRIQFTPDLVPADLVGTRIYNQKSGDFSTSLGPVFCNLLLADEINRAPAKVQSALLEVMQERQVTIAGQTHKVPEPFLVMATQNPIETEGTYPLPEAQVDRFMMKVLVGYPSEEEEFVIVERVTGAALDVAEVATTEQLSALQRECRSAYVDPSLIQYAVRLAAATRDPEQYGIKDLARYLTYGASPRASIHLIEAARALAHLRGRNYVLPEDVTDLAPDVLRHRLVLSYEALTDALSADEIVQRIMRQIAAPQKPLEHVRAAAGNGDLAATGLEKVLKKLEWTVIRRLDGLLHGDYRTLFRGFGLDLADLREYQYHDDVRHIDWNVTARLQTPYVREYNEDRDVNAWFLLDLSPSVDFGSGEVRKRSVANDFVAVLARVLTRHGNRVGALLYSDKVDTVIPARSGRRHVLHLMGSMAKRPQLQSARRHAPRRPAARRVLVCQAPLARVRGVGLHQRAGLGEAARAARAAPRGDRRAAVRSARDGAARHRAFRDAGRRDRRAAFHRHPRQGLPAPLRRARAASARRSCAARSATPASTRSSSPPTTTSPTPSCASPICASAARASTPAPCRAISRRPHDLPLARAPVAAALRARSSSPRTS